MEKIDNLQQLKKLGRIFNSEKIVTTEDLSEVLLGIAGVIKSYREQNEKLNADTELIVEKLLSQVESEHSIIVEKVNTIVDNSANKVEKSLEETISRVTEMIQECRSSMPKDGADGRDADEEYIISEVLNRIELPEYKETILDDGEDIVEKINQLPTDNEAFQIDASHIKNLPAIGRGVGSQARNLWQLQDVTLSSPANNDVLKYNSTTGQWENGSAGGGGTPGGSDTQLQYNNAGAFGGISGATTNGTTVTYTTGNLVAHDVKASQSAGMDILSNNGTLTALFGAGGGANSTFYGGSKFDYATASTLAIFDASKNLISAATATYPDLTELSYVKGVTSAIQTQINALANGMIYKGNWDTSAGTFPGGGVAQTGWFYTVSVAGTVDSIVFEIGDRLIAITNNASTTVYAGNWTKLDATDAVTSVFGRVGNVVSANGDYTASQITNVPAGNIAATDVQAAINELDSEKQAINADITLAENTSIILDSALSADGKYTGITRSGTAGTTLAFGDLCHLDPTDSRWELTDANSAINADGDARGILGLCVLASSADGDPTSMLLYGTIRADTAFPSMTINSQMYVSETAGDITGTQPSTSGVVIRVIGMALTSDELLFNPSPDYITHI